MNIHRVITGSLLVLTVTATAWVAVFVFSSARNQPLPLIPRATSPQVSATPLTTTPYRSPSTTQDGGIPSPTPSTPPLPSPPQNSTGLPLSLPDGFAISTFAQGLGKPRVLALDPAGTLLVSVPASGKIVALPDENGDGTADAVVTVASGLNRPHGLAIRCPSNTWRGTGSCQLYIAESHQVVAYDYNPGQRKVSRPRKIIDLPNGGNHFTRTLLFQPTPADAAFTERRLLVSVGSSCNVCNEADWRRAKVLVTNYDGGELKPFASGLRNSVFLTLHPATGQVWATEMGRDWLGDNLPPDEINIVEEEKNYGWPICYGQNIHDADFDKNTYIRNPCQTPFETPSTLDIPAHAAPLGLAFIPEEGWPERYRHHLLVALHGSWNRSQPAGYKVVRFPLNAKGKPAGSISDFITGWISPDGKTLGRPVDILALPGGVAYLSDDAAGVIYLLTVTR